MGGGAYYLSSPEKGGLGGGFLGFTVCQLGVLNCHEN